MPVRKIPKSYCNVTGLTATDKSDQMTAYESGLEHKCHKLLTFNNNVLKYEEQPVKIYFTEKDGKRHSYIPDVILSYRQDIAPAKYWKPLLAEIKWRTDLFKNWQDLKSKIRAAQQYARERDWDFSILTDKEIITPYLHSAIFLLTFRKFPRNEADCNLLLQALNDLRETDPETLLLALTSDRDRKAELLPMLWQLVANNAIGANLNSRLTMRSRIWAMQVHEEVEEDEGVYQLSAGRGHRIRWRALRHHKHFDLEHSSG